MVTYCTIWYNIDAYKCKKQYMIVHYYTILYNTVHCCVLTYTIIVEMVIFTMHSITFTILQVSVFFKKCCSLYSAMYTVQYCHCKFYNVYISDFAVQYSMYITVTALSSVQNCHFTIAHKVHFSIHYNYKVQNIVWTLMFREVL